MSGAFPGPGRPGRFSRGDERHQRNLPAGEQGGQPRRVDPRGVRQTRHRGRSRRRGYDENPGRDESGADTCTATTTIAIAIVARGSGSERRHPRPLSKIPHAWPRAFPTSSNGSNPCVLRNKRTDYADTPGNHRTDRNAAHRPLRRARSAANRPDHCNGTRRALPDRPGRRAGQRARNQ